MRIRLLLAALFVGGMAEARADLVFSATAYGGPGQAVVVCYYSAPTTKNIVITESIIVRENGAVLAETSDNCSGSFAGGGCRTVANVNTGNSHLCQATVNNKKNVRGRLEVRDNTGNVLTTEEIR